MELIRRRSTADPYSKLYYIFVFFLFCFIAAPVVSVFLYGIFPLNNPASFRDSLIRSIPYLSRNLILAVIVTPLAVMIGVSAAFTIHRFSSPLNKFFRYLILVSIVHPPFVGSISFIMLFGKRGLITHQLLGLDVSPYGLQGIALMQVLGLSSLVYLIISSSISRMDPSIEDAARNIGATEAQIFRDITLKKMYPEISTSAILVFLASMADFETPLIIGGAYQTLSSDLYIQITGLYDMRSAAISGILLMIPCVALFFAYRKINRNKAYYDMSISGSSIQYRHYSRPLKIALFTITALYCAFVLLKYGFIIIGAFTKHWGYDYSFTLQHFQKVMDKDLSPFLNSLKLAFFTALISSSVGVFLSYIVKRKGYRFRALTDLLATIPIAIPGILLGIGYLVTFKYPILGIGRFILKEQQPLVLLGTGIIIYIICIFRYLNTGMRIGYSLIEHINPDIEDAARNLGQRESAVYREIVFPLLSPAFRNSFFRVFATTMTTLGAIIFLLLPSNKVAVQSIFQIITSSERGVAASMSIMLSLLTLLMLGLFYLLNMLIEKLTK